jgi:lipoprotein NlpI
MRIELFVAAVFAALVAAASALGASQQDRDDCGGSDPDRKIAGCSRVLSDSGESQANRAAAHYNRGSAWHIKGDFDRAIADYNEAIRLGPKAVQPYNNRGGAWYIKGDLDRAIADYSEAIRLDPKAIEPYNNRGLAWRDKGDSDRAIADLTEAIRRYPNYIDAYGNRGLTYFYKGDFGRAAVDFLHYNNLASNAYTMLWRYLALGRLGQDGAGELAANAARLNNKDWPYPVIDFYLGKVSLDALTSAATTPAEHCHLAFYTGEWRLLRSQPMEAKLALQHAVDICPKVSALYEGAVAELKLLSP